GPIKSQYLSYFVYGLFASGLFLHVFINLFRLVKQKKRELSLEIFLIIYFTVFILATCFSSAPIRCIGYYGFNSMETLAEYYIVSLQPIMLIIFLLLLKYRSNFFIWINLSVSIVFILGYVNLFSCPYYNEELFRPHCNLHGNVYECGFNYVRHPELFLRFRQKLPPELRDEYMQGAWEFFSLGSDRQKELLEKAKTFDVDGVYREFEK
ncbi:MAG: hypothetical protein JW734_02180, partial [Candidatus Omnitrophica bacterium]|nr:hypothetical protein [Candidatus Omnitrophota bacterium]